MLTLQPVWRSAAESSRLLAVIFQAKSAQTVTELPRNAN